MPPRLPILLVFLVSTPVMSQENEDARVAQARVFALSFVAALTQESTFDVKVLQKFLNPGPWAKRILGKTWGTISEDKQLLSRRILARYIACILNKKSRSYFRDFPVSIRGIIIKNNTATVAMEASHKKVLVKNIELILSYLSRSQTWLIYDIRFEGSSLLSNYRKDIGRAISEDGFDKTMENLGHIVKNCKKSL